MKKFLIAILAVLYLATSSGAIVHFHYCMGKLTSWGLTDSKDDRCANCGMTKNGKNCCNEEHKLIKVADDQKASSIAYELTQFSAVANIYYMQPSFLAVSSVTEQNPLTNSPPRQCKQPLYLRNCTFRI